MSSHKDQIAYSLFSHHVTDNYAMACEPEVSHAGGQAAGRVVLNQRGLSSIQVTVVEGLCVVSTLLHPF